VIPFDVAGRTGRVTGLEERAARPDLWRDAAAARAMLQQLEALRGPLEAYHGLTKRRDDLAELIELGKPEEDPDLGREIAGDLEALQRDAVDLEVRILLTGKYDTKSAIVAFHPGAGGTESQDWAEMLMRMYTRWAERRGFKVEVLDFLEGEEAGIKSATLLIGGPYAYGFLRAEKGVHRLVRISPFDSSGRRHTSFASVDVLPEIAEDHGVEIDPDDIRVDTFRSSGAGGQHVNKTDSAVRITHIPTGIVATCQNERSQHANRLTAMRILRARLIDRQEAEREKELAALRGQTQEIAWGSQIRSYVFQPYSLVKDHRTGLETGNVQAVMGGDVDRFVYAYLRRAARGRDAPPEAPGGAAADHAAGRG
jgi:peptide chain release factor 2